MMELTIDQKKTRNLLNHVKSERSCKKRKGGTNFWKDGMERASKYIVWKCVIYERQGIREGTKSQVGDFIRLELD